MCKSGELARAEGRGFGEDALVGGCEAGFRDGFEGRGDAGGVGELSEVRVGGVGDISNSVNCFVHRDGGRSVIGLHSQFDDALVGNLSMITLSQGIRF